MSDTSAVDVFILAAVCKENKEKRKIREWR
jgi:hypothetical protein